MKPTISAVLAKAQALVAGLSSMPRSARAAIPHGHFARDYNTLRKLALSVAPELDERLFGKYIGVSRTSEGEFSQANYVEIEAYARQIVDQLALLLKSNTTGPAAMDPPPRPDATAPKTYNVAAIRKEYNQAYASWSKDDDAYLRARFLEGAPIADLVSEFGRKPIAIRSRLRKLGLDMAGIPSVPGGHSIDYVKVRKPNQVRFLSGKIAGVWVVVNLHKPGFYRHENAHVAAALRVLADAIERTEVALADHDTQLHVASKRATRAMAQWGQPESLAHKKSV
jgi:hypothetical protein